MSPTMKISLLALISSAAAIPHYGHSKYHSIKPTGAYGTGHHGKPYPTGGWGGSHNQTRPSGTGSYDDDVTTTRTTTLTSTLTSTVTIKPSTASQSKVVVENVSQPPADGQCGPATVTVTASEKVYITVTPGGGAGAPSSSAASVYPDGGNYGVSSKAPEPTPAQPQSSKAPEPSPVKPQSSKAEEYKPISSLVEKPVASSAAPSSAAPKPTPGSGNGYSGTKRGLAYNKAELCKSLGSKFGFGYNWGQVENNDIGAPFVPMMHGPSKGTSQEWLSNVEKASKKGSKAVMGFNECDHKDQCNLDPQAACAAWKEYMNPIASKHPELTIIGPSVTNGPAPMGLAWLSNFHKACPDAVVHASNIHFYDIYDDNTINRFKAQVEQASKEYGLPVWVTEFGLNPGSATQEQAASFLKEAMAYMDGNDKVQGYSWFMVGEGENQLNAGSGLSAIGKVYAGQA